MVTLDKPVQHRGRRARRPRAAITIGLIAALLATIATIGSGAAAADPGDQSCGLNPACWVGKAGGKAVNAAVGGTFDKIVSSMAEAMGKLLEMAMSWWLVIPSPKLDPRGSVGVLATVKDYTWQLQLIGLTVSLMMVGIRLAISRKGLIEESEQVWHAVARAVFGSTMFASFVFAMTGIGDAFSNWVLKDAVLHGQGAGEAIQSLGLASMVGGAVGGPAGATFPIAGIGLIALVGFLGALLQVILLVIRQVMMVVVVAFVPIAATFSGTGPGSQSYDKLKQWTIAFLLFKPVGALVYVIAFSAAGTETNDFQMKLLGIILLAMVAFVLPSLMRLVAPAVGAMGAGGSGAQALGMTVGAGMLAAKGVKALASGGASEATTGMSSVASRTSPGAEATFGDSGGDGSPGAAGGPGPTPTPSGPDSSGGGAATAGAGGASSTDPTSGAGPNEALAGGGTPSGGGASAVAGHMEQAVGNESSTGGAESSSAAAGSRPSLDRPALASGHGEHAMKA